MSIRLKKVLLIIGSILCVGIICISLALIIENANRSTLTVCCAYRLEDEIILGDNGGSVLINEKEVSSQKVVNGESIKLSATAENEFKFVGYFYDNEFLQSISNEEINEFSINQDTTIYAYFSKKYVVSLTVQNNDGEKVVGLCKDCYYRESVNYVSMIEESLGAEMALNYVNSLPEFYDNHTDSNVNFEKVSFEMPKKNIDIKLSPSEIDVVGLSGSGTTGAPYLISTAADLISASSLCASDSSYRSKVFSLQANINLNTNLTSVSYNTSTGNIELTVSGTKYYLGTGRGSVAKGSWSGSTPSLTSWTPFGASGQFTGQLIGNDYSISGIFINSTASQRGLIGYGYESTVKNIVFKNSVVLGGEQTSIVYGYHYGAALQYCVNDTSVVVVGTSNVGGFVGYGLHGGSVVDSVNYATIIGTGSYVAGCYGQSPYNYWGGCYNCVNHGLVYGGSYVGGVMGYRGGDSNGTCIHNCVNTGAVSGSSSANAVCGYSSPSVTNCYYLSGSGGTGYGSSFTLSNAATVIEDLNSRVPGYMARNDGYGSKTNYYYTNWIANAAGYPTLVLDVNLAGLISYIKYDANGGSGGPGTQYKQENVNITISSSQPTRTGYKFLGWSTSSTATTPDSKYAAGATYSGNTDLTLYAVWEAMWVISYDANGGSGAPATHYRAKNQTDFTLSTTKPTRTGYNFLGWSTSSTATTPSYASGAAYNTEANLSLYAVWDRNWVIAYDANGGTNAPAVQYRAKNQTGFTLSTARPTNTGYTFIGWSKNQSATTGDSTYDPGAVYSSEADLNLYAIWNKNWVISYNANGGTNAPAVQYKEKNSFDITLSSSIPSYTGHTFKGWGLTNSTTTVSYLPGAKYTAQADLTLFAIWTLDYTITYNANGGTGAPALQYMSINGQAIISSTVPTKTDAVFVGWATSSTALSPETKYNPGSTYSTNANLTLYAVWGVKGVYAGCSLGTITATNLKETSSYPWTSSSTADGTVYTSGGKAVASVTSSMTLTFTVGVGDPFFSYQVSSESSFDKGWVYLDGSVIVNGVSGDGSLTKYTITGLTQGTSHTLQFKYTKDGSVDRNNDCFQVTVNLSPNIVYNVNGGANGPANQTMAIGKTNTISTTIPTKTGATFGGWAYKSNATTADLMPGQEVILYEAITLYAIWGTYTKITFDANGGELPTRIEGYTCIEYIQSTGSQYIDLNYVPKTNTYIETYLSFSTDFVGSSTRSGIYGTFMGVQENTADTSFTVNFGGASSEYNRIYNWVTTYQGSVSGSTTYPINNSSYASKQFYRLGNGKAQWGSTTINLISKPKNNTLNLYLFAQNNKGDALIFNTHTSMYVYDYFKIYEGSVLVRYYIPCKIQNGEVGLFESVEGKFYGNSGSGSFIAGPEVGYVYDESSEPITASTIMDTPYDHMLFAKWTPKTSQMTYNTCGGTLVNDGKVLFNIDCDLRKWQYMGGSTDCYSNWQFENNMSSFYFYGNSTFEQVYIPFNLKNGYTYTFAFDYTIPKISYSNSSYTPTSGARAELYNTIPPNDGGSGKLAYFNMGTAAGSGTGSFSYTCTANGTYYFSFNNSWLGDSAVMPCSFGNLIVTATDTSLATGKTITYDTAYGYLPTPTRAGYIFDGWWTAETGGTKVTAETICQNENNHQLFAHWIATVQTLTINPTGGTYNSTTSNSTVTGNVTQTTTLETPTRTGYAFAGWTTSGKNSEIISMPGTLNTLGYAMFNNAAINNGNKPTNFNIYNNKGNGTVTHTVIDDTTNPMGTNKSIKIITNGEASPSAGGFYQTISSAAGLTFYQVIVAKIPTGYTMLSARNSCGTDANDAWYDFEAGTWKSDSSSNQCQKGTGEWRVYLYRLICGTSGTFSTAGHKYLVGTSNTSVTWYVGYCQSYRVDSGTSTSVVSGTPWQSSTTYSFGTTDNTIYALWNKIAYTVVYNGNGATSGSMASSSHVYGVAQNLTTNGFARTGHEFLGWSTDMYATTATYTNGQSVTNLTLTNGSTVNLYAVWKKLNYTISYYSTSSSSTYTTQTILYDENYSMPTNPTLDGYSFVGWANSASTTTANWTAGQQTCVGEKSWYAIFAKQLTIKYNGNTGSGSVSSQTETIKLSGCNKTMSDFSITLKANGFTKTNYHFVNWGLGSDTGAPFNAGETLTQANSSLIWNNDSTFTKTFYAIWAGNGYTINYYNGTTKAGTGTYTYGENSTLKTFASLNQTIANQLYGWKFSGWAIANNSITKTFNDGVNITNINIGSEITQGLTINLYAIYERTITFRSGLASSVISSTATQTWNPYNTNASNISSVEAPVPTSLKEEKWITLGYRADQSAGLATYAVQTAKTITPAVDTLNDLYAVYSKEVTITLTDKTTTTTTYYNTSGDQTEITTIS